jgi:hypothetical protein
VWDAIRLRIATDAAGVALWSWNVDTDEIALDERAHGLWGVVGEAVTFEGSLQESDRCVRQAGTDAHAAHAASSDDLVLSGRSWPGPGRSPVSQA